MSCFMLLIMQPDGKNNNFNGARPQFSKGFRLKYF